MRYALTLMLGLCAGCSPQAQEVAKPQECKAPPEWRVTPERLSKMPFRDLLPIMNQLELKADGNLAWNGKPIEETKAEEFMRGAQLLVPQPYIQYVHPESIDCERINAVREWIDTTYQCRDIKGKCEEGAHEETPPPPP